MPRQLLRSLFRGASPFQWGNNESTIRSEAIAALRTIVDPIQGADIITLNMVENVEVDCSTRSASVLLCLPTLAHPRRDEIKNACQKALVGLPLWGKSRGASHPSVEVRARARKPISPLDPAKACGLANVEHIVAVSSCKGGVGKSTVAVNLALAMQAQGARVGLLDADLYGPSLPSLVRPSDTTLRHSSDSTVQDRLIAPLTYFGVKMLSFGWVNRKSGVPGAGGFGAAVMRGAMSSKVAAQLLTKTDWGELDVLVLDMPPGTGDIHITLCQAAPLTGSVLVTTPQALSLIDVVKGVEMFEQMKVPTMAIVENMSYFLCDHGTKHRPFGRGKTAELAEMTNISPKSATFQLPLSAELNSAAENGNPTVLAAPNSPEALVYSQLGEAIIEGALIASSERTTTKSPTVWYDAPRGGIVVRELREEHACEWILPPYEVRIRDSATGLHVSSTDGMTVPQDIKPIKFEPVGSYAVAIDWSDGHRGSIYSYDMLTSLARDLYQDRHDIVLET